MCLVVGFPVAVAITFASEKAKAWLLLLIMLPFWTNLLIRTYALMAILRTEGYANLDACAGCGRARRTVAGAFGYRDGPLPSPAVAATTISRWCSDWSMCSSPSWSCRCIRRSTGWTARSWRRAWTSAPGTAPPSPAMVVPAGHAGDSASGVVITLIPSIGAYLTPDLLGGANSLMISNVIERQFKAANDWPFGAALSFLIDVPHIRGHRRAGGRRAGSQQAWAGGAGMNTLDPSRKDQPGPLEYLKPLAAPGCGWGRRRGLPLHAAPGADGVQLQRQPPQRRLARLHAGLVQGGV